MSYLEFISLLNIVVLLFMSGFFATGAALENSIGIGIIAIVFGYLALNAIKIHNNLPGVFPIIL
jgi:hypothetical protein